MVSETLCYRYYYPSCSLLEPQPRRLASLGNSERDLPHWRRRKCRYASAVRIGSAVREADSARPNSTPHQDSPGGLAVFGHQLCHGLDSVGRLVQHLALLLCSDHWP
jgi:hypothetical protein